MERTNLAKTIRRNSGEKSDALSDLAATVHWHLIGHLQSNKARKTLPRVRMIHSVDSLKLLQVLDELANTRCQSCLGLPSGQRIG